MTTLTDALSLEAAPSARVRAESRGEENVRRNTCGDRSPVEPEVLAGIRRI